MKVLQINITCNKGSTGKIAKGINETLIKHGHEGIIAYGYGRSEYEHSFKFGGKINYYYHNIMSRIFGHEGFYSKLATKRFIKWIDTYTPDIIHLHNIHGHYVNIQLLFNYIKNKKIPIVWTLHDCWPITGKCVYFNMIQCMKWKLECNKCPLLDKYPSSLFDSSKQDFLRKKKLFSNIESMKLITPSYWLKDLVRYSHINKYPIDIINNTIDIEIFKPRMMSDENLKKKLNRKFVALAVAALWDERKGFGDLLKLTKITQESCDIIFIIVGLSNKQIKLLPKNTIGINKTENQIKLAELYSRADVFINPTYEDNYPTVNLEALACGTPIITYDTGGSGEIVNKFDFGFIIEKGNVSEIINKINLIKNGERKFEKKIDTKLLSQSENNLSYLEIYKNSIRSNKIFL